MLTNTLKVKLLLSILCFQSIILHNNSLTQATTQVKWTGNNDPNAPDAATAPRSQKYWDENNIERPDYAKTDAEIAAEKRSGKSSSSDGGLNFEDSPTTSSRSKIFRMTIGAIFIGSWIGIYQFGMGKKGTKLGSSLGSNSSSASTMQGKNLLNYAMKMKKEDHESLEEKARKARLARFEKKASKED